MRAFNLSLLFFSQCLWANDLIEAAKERLNHVVFYDGAYQSIAYPMGDVDKNKGVCTDVIVRSYRTLGIDLQQLVHEDMALNFKNYPQMWGLKKPDSNIDHRRVPNLETFFSRFGTKLPMTKNPDIYQPGDIVGYPDQPIREPAEFVFWNIHKGKPEPLYLFFLRKVAPFLNFGA